MRLSPASQDDSILFTWGSLLFFLMWLPLVGTQSGFRWLFISGTICAYVSAAIVFLIAAISQNQIDNLAIHQFLIPAVAAVFVVPVLYSAWLLGVISGSVLYVVLWAFPCPGPDAPGGAERGIITPTDAADLRGANAQGD